MALVIEDGTGKSDAQSYVSSSDIATYAQLYGLTPPASANPAIMQAMRFIEGMYFDRWIGIKKTEEQALAWPRAYAVRRDGYSISESTIPQCLKDAVCALALKVTDGEDLLPKFTRSDVALEEQVGPLRVKYAAGAPAIAIYRDIEAILIPIVIPRMFGKVARS